MWKHLIIVSILFAIRLSAYKLISIKPTLYSRLLRQSHVQLSAATLNEPKLSNSAAVKYSGYIDTMFTMYLDVIYEYII